MRFLLSLLIFALLIGLAWLWQSRSLPGPGAEPIAAAAGDTAPTSSAAPTSPAAPSSPAAQTPAVPLSERLDAAVIREVNERLAPADPQYTEQVDGNDLQIDLGGRQTSVAVAYIDDDGRAVVVDLTQPIPEQ